VVWVEVSRTRVACYGLGWVPATQIMAFIQLGMPVKQWGLGSRVNNETIASDTIEPYVAVQAYESTEKCVGG
jgi:hypothetical protein